MLLNWKTFGKLAENVARPTINHKYIRNDNVKAKEEEKIRLLPRTQKDCLLTEINGEPYLQQQNKDLSRRRII